MELYGSDAEPLAPLVEAESLVVDPPELVLPRLVTCLRTTAPAEPARLLLSPDVVDWVSEAFLLESHLAEAVARDHLRVRETPSRCADRAILAADRAGVLVSVDQQAGVLPVDATPVIEGLYETYEPVWEAAEPLSVRAPPRGRLYETGREQLADAFATQLERAIESASALQWHGSPTPVELVLAIAARTSIHHYDLCAWAEAVGFTSRSTVARTKQQLEKAGVIEVEPVPQERGRPRQQLLVGDERVGAADAENLVPTLRRLAA